MPKVSLGHLYITREAMDTVKPTGLNAAIERFSRGDWGDVDREDWQANDAALEAGSRLLAVYTDGAGVKFWVITEADRSYTTVLLPEDY